MKVYGLAILAVASAVTLGGYAVLGGGCGDQSRGSELTGQVKKVVERTPLVCPDYTEADVSLGVMRNGTGSMSHEDVAVVVEGSQVTILQAAARSGQLVRITYDERRLAACWPDRRATRVEVVAPETP